MSRQRWRALSPLRGLCLAAVVWNIASSSTICIAMPDDTKRPGATWKDTLAAARVAVPVPVDGITVFSGTGKRLRAWEPRALETAAQARRLVAYYSPDVHPARERVLCIRCLERLVKGGNHEREQPEQLECAITELRIDGEGEEQLLALTPGKRISSPVYSPDGETIAILQDDGVSVYAIRQRQIASRFAEVLSHCPTPRPLLAQLMAAKEPLRYLRWAPDGRKLFVFGATPLPITGLREPFPEGMSAPTGVATIDLKSRQVSWLNLFNPWFAGEVYAGQYATVQEGSWVQIKGQLPDVEPVRVLFGSQRHPVMAPLLAPGLPSFFYIQYGEGWFWKTALMRYDIAQDSLTDIRTLARGIFSE